MIGIIRMTNTMETITICFCLVIVHVFGYLEVKETGKEDLKANEDLGQVISYHAEQKSNQYQQIRLGDDRSTARVVTVSSAQGGEAVTSATVAPPLTEKSTTSHEKTATPGKGLESSPRTSPTESNSASKTRISLETETTSDSNYSNRDSLNNATFNKFPTQSKHAVKSIDHYGRASLRGYTDNRKENNRTEIVAKYNEANIKDETLPKQVVGSRAAEASANYEVPRKAEALVRQTVGQNFAPFSKTPSAFRKSYEALKGDDENSSESFPNIVKVWKDERAKSEEAERASPLETENGKLKRVVERTHGLERPIKQRRKKRKTNSTDTSNSQEKIAAPKSENAEVRKAKVEEAKSEETNEANYTSEDEVVEEGQTQEVDGQNSMDGVPVALDVTSLDFDVEASTQAAGNETESCHCNVLLRASIVFAVFTQVIVVIMILSKYSTEIAKKPNGEREPLQPTKNFSSAIPMNRQMSRRL